MSPRRPSWTTRTQASAVNSGQRPSFRHLMEIGLGAVLAALFAFLAIQYYFRHNRRSRHTQELNEDDDQIDLSRIQQLHSQRREERLMSREEVSERFPLTKYKVWKSARGEQGLPIGSGVTVPTSGAASVQDREGTAGDADNDDDDDEEEKEKKQQLVCMASSRIALKITRQDHASANSARRPSATDIAGDASNAEKGAVECTEIPAMESPYNDRNNLVAMVDSDGPEDPICGVTSRAMLAVPDDSCVICLDPLQDEDNVRGLACGHAFHATCVDPWLISRRACCPLCKTDYFVSKPKPGRTQLMNLPQRPPLAWVSARGGIPVLP